MQFDFGKLKKGIKVFEIVPELSMYKEFQNQDEDLLKFVIFFTDMESPYFEKYRDLQDKMRAVYEGEGLKHSKLKEVAVNGSKIDLKFYGQLMGMIHKYFMLTDNISYTAWYSAYCFYQETNQFLQLPIDPNDKNYEQKYTQKTNVSMRQGDQLKRLSELEKSVFTDTTLKRVVVNEVSKFINYPERYAKNIDGLD